MNPIVAGRGLLIGGEWRQSASHGVAEFRSPFDGRVVANVPVASAIEVKQAGDRAAVALSREPLRPSQRSAILRRTAERPRERSGELPRLLALESGKPMREARGEVGRATMVLEESAEEGRSIGGDMVLVDAVLGSEDRLAFTMRVPKGIVAATTPFNAPLMSPAHKVGAAIAAGSAVIFKPATPTPLYAQMTDERLVGQKRRLA